MNGPDVLCKLEPVGEPVGTAALFQDQLPNAGPEPLQGLGDVRRKPAGNLRQGTGCAATITMAGSSPMPGTPRPPDWPPAAAATGRFRNGGFW